MTVPVRGGYTVRFEAGRASIPNDVADVLVMLGGGFYTLPEAQAEGLATGQSVLVIRDLGMGDVLLATPLIRHLAQKGVLVDVQTSQRFVCLFDGNPHVRIAFSLETGQPDHAAYDAVLDLRMFVENAENQQHYQHRVPGFALAADIELSEGEYHLDYFPRRGEMEALVEKVNRKLSDTGRPLIAYVWGAMSDTRSWGLAQHQAVLTALLAEDYQVIVLSAAPQPVPTENVQLFNATGRFSLREAASALLLSAVVVTPDTGLFHLASALDKPVVTYFGSWPITERATHTQLSVLNAPQNCARLPCRSSQCFNREADGQPRCLSVAPLIVVGAVKQQLGQCQKSLESDVGKTASAECDNAGVRLSDCRAAVFCTAAIDTDPARYQAWADYYTAFFAGEDVDLFLFNDGPAQHQITGAAAVIPIGDSALGRTEAGGLFPGWKRSMGAALQHLASYPCLAHVESDLGLTSGGKAAFLKALRSPGFMTGWCPRHEFPETALQIFNDAFARAWYIHRYADRADLWTETFDGECFEHLLERELSPVYILTGDRHEGDPPAFDASWDYLAQCPLTEFQQLYTCQEEATSD